MPRTVQDTDTRRTLRREGDRELITALENIRAECRASDSDLDVKNLSQRIDSIYGMAHRALHYGLSNQPRECCGGRCHESDGMGPHDAVMDWNDTSNPAVRQAEREEREDYELAGCDTQESLDRDAECDEDFYA